MGLEPTIAWLKRRPRAYRRRFARSPRFQNRAGLKIVGAADGFKKYTMRGDSQRI